MSKVFILQGNNAGKSVLLMNRYKFVDGVMLEEDDESAKMMTANLVGFYGCVCMDFDEYQRKKSAAKPASTPPSPAPVPPPPKPAAKASE